MNVEQIDHCLEYFKDNKTVGREYGTDCLTEKSMLKKIRQYIRMGFHVYYANYKTGVLFVNTEEPTGEELNEIEKENKAFDKIEATNYFYSF